jgi:hypothetical protein
MAETVRVWLAVLVVSALGAFGCGGGSGGGGASPDGDAVFLGSCTGSPAKEGDTWSCIETAEERDTHLDAEGQVSMWRSACVNAESTYASGHCAGNYVGCCTRTQEEPTYRSERTCHYGPGDWSAMPTACEALGGVWE